MIAVRSAVFAVITVGLTGLAHAAAGGAVPPLEALAVLVLVTAAVGLPLFRRGLRPMVLVSVVGTAQVVLHPMFEGLAGLDPAGHAGHGSSPGMLAAHVVAGILAVLVVTALDPVLRCLRLRGPRLRFASGFIRVRPTAPCRSVPILDDMVTTPWMVALAAPRRGPPPPALPATF